MIAYASRTGTRRNLAALRGAGWRLMVSARGVLRTEGFPYALDNGAWTAHQKGEPFDVELFERAYRLLGSGADFVVVPDIVAGGVASLEMSVGWLPRLSDARRLLIPVQDGMSLDDVRPHLSRDVGVFVGGSCRWKDETMHEWSALAKSIPTYIHVGRVNTRRRIKLCAHAGVDSFDGSSVTRYAVNIHHLEAERRQLSCLG